MILIASLKLKGNNSTISSQWAKLRKAKSSHYFFGVPHHIVSYSSQRYLVRALPW